MYKRLTGMVIFTIIFLTFFNNTEASWERVSVETFEEEIMNNPAALLLDVRTTAEWEQDGHLEDALLIPHSDLESRSDELPEDKENLILLYCRSGNRSQEAAETLIDLGYMNIIELASGINGWKDADKTVLYGK